jgi:hypothetical protein
MAGDLPGVVREHSCVTSGEVESPGVGVANEDTGASLAFVEVKPLLCLCWRSILCVNNEVTTGNVRWDANGAREEHRASA